MEGFKNTTKIKYFKEGGFVTKKEFTTFEKKEDKREEAKDTAKDTQLVKKGVSQHESFLHKGEPKTQLKLNCGGRAKKSVGTVNKYKAGGNVSNVYEAKKDSGDKDAIRKVKDIVPTKLCGGKSVKKYQAGGGVSVDQKLAALEQQRAREKMKRAMMLDPAQQNQLIKQSPAAAGLTPPAPAGLPAAAPAAPVADVNSMPMKKGGKAKKC